MTCMQLSAVFRPDACLPATRCGGFPGGDGSRSVFSWYAAGGWVVLLFALLVLLILATAVSC